MNGVSPDGRLVLSEPELDAALESLLLAEASVWAAADAALETGQPKLGRSHWRCAFLLRRRPGLGVQALAELTGVTKQSVSRTVKELTASNLVETELSEDGRRRRLRLTPLGLAFEAAAGERLRAELAGAYREAGVEAAGGARRVWTSLAGSRGRAARHRATAP
jgi:DNA-binding MarR family transcriptional regulator